MRVHPAESVRHLVLRASEGDLLPDGLIETLRSERVACGWLRASGVLTDVSLRAYDPEIRGLGGSYVIAGPVQALAVDGCVGVVDGAPSCSLRAILARDTDGGLETLGGEVESARIVALDVLVTVFDDLALARSLDAGAGIWMFGSPGDAPARRGATGDARARTNPGWSAALEASADADRGSAPRARSSAQAPSAGIPARPARPGIDLDAPVPEAGDVVDHFAFGRCDVLKSDGDRLHLKIHKDGRIREIALEMLRVIRLPGEPPGDERRPRRFKLERRI
jgi:predicted DNA-binding protein with PD1-like motif